MIGMEEVKVPVLNQTEKLFDPVDPGGFKKLDTGVLKDDDHFHEKSHP